MDSNYGELPSINSYESPNKSEFKKRIWTKSLNHVAGNIIINKEEYPSVEFDDEAEKQCYEHGIKKSMKSLSR